MPIYAPTATSYPTGVVTITSTDGTTYQSIQESIGSYIYEIINVYLKANSIEQLLNQITFQKYDSNGNIQSVKTIPTVDPTQYQSSLNIEFENSQYILDGKLNIFYNVDANEEVFMNLTVNTLDRIVFLDREETNEI